MLNRKLALAIIAYSLAAPLLGWLVQSWVPWMARATFSTGLLGGGLCLIWGVLAWLGKRVRGWAIFTLGVMAYIILSDTVTMWLERKFYKILLLVTLLLGLTVVLRTHPRFGDEGKRAGSLGLRWPSTAFCLG